MGRVDCGGDNNWDNCDALEIEKGTNGFYRTTPRFPLPHSLLAARLVLDKKEFLKSFPAQDRDREGTRHAPASLLDR
jgi:hypothetical protein